jgi:hypothetical protein
LICCSSGCSDVGVVGELCPAAICAPFMADSGSKPSDSSVAPPQDAASVCQPTFQAAQGKRLDIYMLIDDSGSLLPWWFQTVDSIKQFFRDPASSGVGVGMQFFGTQCDVSVYAQPRVPIAPLPDNLAALELAFPALPVEETATLPALQGVLQHARVWARAHEDTKVVLLMLTDDLPEECGSTIDNVVQVAREGFEDTPSIQTFVVVLGTLGVLNQLAQTGGTNQARFVAPDAQQDLVQALKEVRDLALPCELSLPPQPFAAERVNLQYTGDDGQANVIKAVRDGTGCNSDQGGWYYDDAAAPRQIVLCQQTCHRFDERSALKLALGCPTIWL